MFSYLVEPNLLVNRGAIRPHVPAILRLAPKLRHLGKQIFANSALGVDLALPTRNDYPSEGVTPNDVRDLDTTANNLQNFPTVISAAVGANSTTLEGVINTAPGGAIWR